MRIGTQADRALLFAGGVQERFQFRFASKHLFDESNQLGLVSLLQNGVDVLLLNKVLGLGIPCEEQRGRMFKPHDYGTGTYGFYYTIDLDTSLYLVNICL